MIQRIGVLVLFACLSSLKARAADYVCVVTVPNAGDAVRDPSVGQPGHLYVGVQTDFLGKQSAEEHASDFLLHVHYYAGQRWQKDPYGGDGKSIVSTCVPFGDTAGAMAYLAQRYPNTFSIDSNAYISRTNFDGRPEK